MESNTSFSDSPSQSGEKVTADQFAMLKERVEQLEFNIMAFIDNVRNVQFRCEAAEAKKWMLDWEHEIFQGDLRDEEDDTSNRDTGGRIGPGT